ncbi:hypothetical protein [Streptomyces sp. MMBL 11-3]|uniref:hypothetical protein n=1 Tax=Streptomyces sp. MMBL 11-3 TaxID=3382639 RepID=UPI0039B3ABF1
MPLRRTARALSATALTTLVLGTAAGAAAADPAAEVSPRTVAPGGTVTVSVTCERTGGHPPGTVEATSQAFEHGTVRLHKDGHGGGDHPGRDGEGLRDEEDLIPDGDPLGEEDLLDEEEPLGEDEPPADEGPADREGPTGADDRAGTDRLTAKDDLAAADDVTGTDDLKGVPGPEGRVTYRGTARIAPAADFEQGGNGGDGGGNGGSGPSEWSVDGVCPAAHGGTGEPWSASFTVSRDPSHHTGTRHGVHAGTGGTFDDSPVALAAGGVLIAGALGAAVHRLRRREPSRNR